MTLTDEIKILDDKIKANQVQYDLEREAANISALSSEELENYKDLTGEDINQEQLNKLNLKILHQVKFLIRDWSKKTKKKDF